MELCMRNQWFALLISSCRLLSLYGNRLISYLLFICSFDLTAEGIPAALKLHEIVWNCEGWRWWSPTNLRLCRHQRQERWRGCFNKQLIKPRNFRVDYWLPAARFKLLEMIVCKVFSFWS